MEKIRVSIDPYYRHAHLDLTSEDVINYRIGFVLQWLTERTEKTWKERIHNGYYERSGVTASWNFARPDFGNGRITSDGLYVTDYDDPDLYPLYHFKLDDKELYIYPYEIFAVLENGEQWIDRLD